MSMPSTYGVICQDAKGTFIVHEDLTWAEAVAQGAKISPRRKPSIFSTVLAFKSPADQAICTHEPVVGPGRTACRSCGLVLSPPAPSL